MFFRASFGNWCCLFNADEFLVGLHHPFRNAKLDWGEGSERNSDIYVLV